MGGFSTARRPKKDLASILFGRTVPDKVDGETP